MRIKLLILLISICQTSFAQLIPFKMGDIVTGIKYGYEDKKGKVIVDPIYQETFEFKNGLGRVKSDKFLYGFVDATGKVVIPIKYASASDFHEGLAAVGTGSFGSATHGYIDKTGKFVIPPKYMSAKDFKNGLAEVSVSIGGHRKWGVIDKTGKVVVTPKFDLCDILNSGLIKVTAYTPEEVISYYDKTGKKHQSEKDYKIYLNDQIAKTPFEEYIKSNVMSWEEYVKEKCLPEEPKLTEEALQKQIVDELEKWKQKSEFESVADWQARVTPETAAEKAEEILNGIKSEYEAKSLEYQTALDNAIKDYDNNYYRPAVNRYCGAKASVFRRQNFELSTYDAENQTFLISASEAGSILLPVPKEEAQAFKENWATIKTKCKPVFVPAGNEIVLKSVKFGNFVYDSNTKAVYATNDAVNNFKPLEIKLPDNLDYTVSTNNKTDNAPRYVLSSRSNSDIDTDIPNGSAVRNNTVAIIIANENYEHCVNVEYALNDGQAVKEYFNRTIGIPEKQIFVYRDASLSQMVGAIDRIAKLSDVYDPASLEVIVYYAGHGIPNEKDRSAYLIPTDSDPMITETCLPLNRLYDQLGKSGASSVKVFLDACFSGSLRGDGMLVSARGVAIKPRPSEPVSRTFVLTATSDDQTAWPYDEKKHGAFTYFLLKKIKETSGDVTLGELSDYVNDNVKKTIYLNKQKVQTPRVSTSFDMQPEWRVSKL